MVAPSPEPLSDVDDPLDRDQLEQLHAWWRAANYLAVGQIYLLDNPLLREPLQAVHIKPRLLGHWGTTPGLNLVWAHATRLVRERGLDAVFVAWPGYGGPGPNAAAWLEGTYSELYRHISQDERGMRRFFRQFSFPGGVPSHCAPETSGSSRVLGTWLRDIVAANRSSFLITAPDELASNRLQDVLDVTGRRWDTLTGPGDDRLDPAGRAVEMLSEHVCEGLQEGYLLTGLHGLFTCYEAYIYIIDAMMNQHAKWLESTAKIPWRRPLASLNYLLSSHVWRQDHNGFSHQDPGFLDVVLACAGDVPTSETLAAAALVRQRLPQLRVRVVNVVDLMRLLPASKHPHALPDKEFDAIFTPDRPVIFAFHGYPHLVHRLTYARRNHAQLHVHGYQENGTTTPFDLVMLNDLDRFSLVIDVIDRVPDLGTLTAGLRQEMVDPRLSARAYTRRHGEDAPEIAG
jgi:phosphoketolase